MISIGAHVLLQQQRPAGGILELQTRKWSGSRHKHLVDTAKDKEHARIPPVAAIAAAVPPEASAAAQWTHQQQQELIKQNLGLPAGDDQHVSIKTQQFQQPDQQQHDLQEQRPSQQQHSTTEHQQGQQGPTPHHKRTWKPKWELHKVRSIKGVCRMLQQHQQELSPALWVRGFTQVVRLVGEGQQVPAARWQQLRDSLMYLAAPATPEAAAAATAPKGGAAVDTAAAEGWSTAAAAAAPISQFTAWQLATLLWATANLGLQVPTAAWPPILAHISHVSSSMSPREISLSVWALSRLQPPGACEGVVLQLLERSNQPLQAYSPKPLVLLLNSLARMKLQFPPERQQELLEAAAAHIAGSSTSTTSRNSSSKSSSSSRNSSRGGSSFSGQDLSLLVWSLPALCITPPAPLLLSVLQASRPHLPALSCAELTALLVGVGRLRFVPPGPWVLDMFDQLYWSVDQLSLRQLCGVVWALGRLRLVAVPPELLDRLLTFVGVHLQQQQHQQEQQGSQQQQQQQQPPAADAEYKERFTLAKQLSLLLTGLAGLSQQLSHQQQQQCSSWLRLVLEVHSPQAALQVASSLHAAAQLQVRVSSPADRTLVFSAVSALQGHVDLPALALGVWGAMGVGCQPDQQQLQQWLQPTVPAVATAGARELHMLLHACVRAKQLPDAVWFQAVLQRLQQVVGGMSGRNCVFLSQLLLELTLLQQQQQQQQQPAVAAAESDAAAPSSLSAAAAAAGVTHGVHQLLSLLSVRVEQLEVHQAISSRALQNFERNRQLLTQLLAAGASPKVDKD